jgi:hypothetical protein
MELVWHGGVWCCYRPTVTLDIRLATYKANTNLCKGAEERQMVKVRFTESTADQFCVAYESQ